MTMKNSRQKGKESFKKKLPKIFITLKKSANFEENMRKFNDMKQEKIDAEAAKKAELEEAATKGEPKKAEEGEAKKEE
jgi:hypothetical protein